MSNVDLRHGDCLAVMRELPDNSVDAVVCDPPYGLEFMGKEWDKFVPERGRTTASPTPTAAGGFSDDGSAWAKMRGGTTPPTTRRCTKCNGWTGTFSAARAERQKQCECDAPTFPPGAGPQMLAFGRWCEQWATECLRVLKPGGHMLAFGGTRTWHRLACAVEDAGFEMRDNIAWLYGSGFSKGGLLGNKPDAHLIDPKFHGFSTTLKPAFEPVVVARKPLVGTVAQNVQQFGTGALNIDATRIHSGPSAGGSISGASALGQSSGWNAHNNRTTEIDRSMAAGRWPANVCLDSDQAAALDQMSGIEKSRPIGRPSVGVKKHTGATDIGKSMVNSAIGYTDTGGASRFFLTAEPDAPDLPIDELAERFMYCAKAPKSERPTYVKEGQAKDTYGTRKRCAICGKQQVNSQPSSMCSCAEPDWQADPSMQGVVSHPTVKPLALCRWLVRLVTPPGGTILEPFAGSGATVEAAILEGFDVIAIEREADYLPLIQQRIFRAHAKVLADAEQDDESHPSLFDDEGAA